MRRLTPVLAVLLCAAAPVDSTDQPPRHVTWLVAQLGPYGTSATCWILPGVTARVTTRGERIWLSQTPDLDGWMQRVEVQGSGSKALDAAARSVGLPNADRCVR